MFIDDLRVEILLNPLNQQAHQTISYNMPKEDVRPIWWNCKLQAQ
jgi:hypothetical protein